MDHMESSSSALNGDTNVALKNSISAEVKRIFESSEDGAGKSIDDVDMISNDPFSPNDSSGNESAQSVEVKVCDICGDAGRENWLAVCSKCKDGAEHIYCMRITMNELPDSSWMCEECALSKEKDKMKSVNPVQSVTYERRKSLIKGLGQKKPTQINSKGLGVYTSRGEKASPLSSADGISSNQTTLMRKRTERETKIGLASISRDHKASSLQDIALCGSFTKSKSFNDSDKRPKVLVPQSQLSNETRGRKKFSSLSSLRKTVSFNDASSGRPVASSPRFQSTNNDFSVVKSPLSSSNAIQEDKLASQMGSSSQTENSKSNADNMQDGGNECNNRSEENSDYASYRQLGTFAFPNLDYIWRGQFEIQQSNRLPNIMYGIQAHLSTQASSSIPEAVKKFSSKISLEEVSRVNAWPTQFQEHRPQDDSIALYFFAQDNASYINYRSLLHSMTDNDLALRGNVGGIEVLIFSSSVLPEGSRYWNGLLYLWGVFRCRKVAESQPAV